MNKRIVKRYKLKENVKMILCIMILGTMFYGTLYMYKIRIENLDKAGETERKSIKIIVKK